MIDLATALGGPDILRSGAAILSAARTLRILVCTGFSVAGRPETDGPVGGLILARALRELKCPVALVSYRDVLDILTSTSGPQIDVVDVPCGTHCASVEGVPVTIEVCGQVADGTYRNMLHEDISAVAPQFETAIGFHALVSVGDGGNEFGFGSAPVGWFERNRVLRPVSTCDYLVPAEVSNWGALALVAALQVLSGVHLLPSPTEYQSLLDSLARAGMVDGVLRISQATEDGLKEGAGSRIVEALDSWARGELRRE